jgi:4-amino-4-deoxy-L-arabinose transferase-like glycosyltransferase
MKKEHILILSILAVALVLRLVVVFSVQPPAVVMDAESYDRAAKNILHHHTFAFFDARPTAFTVPGFPLLLSAIYIVFGESNFTAVRLINCVLSVLTIFFVYLIGREIFEQKTIPLIAAVLLAVYIPALTANQYILTEVLFSFILIVFFYVFLLALKSPGIKLQLLAGFLLGLCCLVRPVPFFFPAFVFLIQFAAYIIRSRKEGISAFFQSNLKRYGLLYLATVLALSPWIIRNYVVFDKFIPFATQSGHPFLKGSYYNYDFPAGEVWIKGLSEIEQNKHWWREGKKHFWEELNKSPARYSYWYLSKIHRLWHRPHVSSQVNWKIRKIAVMEHSILVWLCSFAFIILIVSKNGFSRLPIVYLIYHTVMHIPFLGSGRYFFPATAFVLILSAYCIDLILRSLVTFLSREDKKLCPAPIRFLLFFLGLFFLYFLLIIRYNFRQSSGILNLDFHPVLLSKAFGAIVSAAILIYLAAIIIFLFRFKFANTRTTRIGVIAFCLLFYAGEVLKLGPIGLAGFEVALAFDAPLRQNATVEQIIDLPDWTKGYPDNKLILFISNSDAKPLDYNLHITVNSKVIKDLKKGDTFNSAELQVPISTDLIEESEILHIRVFVADEESENYPILRGTTNVYRGISLLNGQDDDLSASPSIQRGTYSIALRLYGKSKLLNVYYWRGSKRAELLKRNSRFGEVTE